jgi:hypothetical protein
MRYFFHLKDGKEILDHEGTELRDASALKQEALMMTTELLGGMSGNEFWNGEPWKLWVTDQPGGAGNTVLILEFTAHQSAALTFAPDVARATA